MEQISSIIGLIAAVAGLLIFVLGAACIQSAERKAEDDPRWNRLAGKREEERLKMQGLKGR